MNVLKRILFVALALGIGAAIGAGLFYLQKRTAPASGTPSASYQLLPTATPTPAPTATPSSSLDSLLKLNTSS